MRALSIRFKVWSSFSLLFYLLVSLSEPEAHSIPSLLSLSFAFPLILLSKAWHFLVGVAFPLLSEPTKEAPRFARLTMFRAAFNGAERRCLGGSSAPERM